MGKSKLTDQDRQEICALHSEGASMKALAQKYGVSYWTIKRVLDPEQYAKHLERAAQYNKENSQQIYIQNNLASRRYIFRLNRQNDADLITHLDSQDNLTEYLRGLIKKDLDETK